uniref:Dehydrogenase/reductase SDR family member 11 n=1 Tax=Octopus bimaculoides TaxID=37653 RepID=A0A0L8HRW1_OCTBM|eukprot:XP_014769982.1 PREDICTED: dehydrogenase/reductase SDR family member 11-like [Octopus bimaculoides]
MLNALTKLNCVKEKDLFSFLLGLVISGHKHRKTKTVFLLLRFLQLTHEIFCTHKVYFCIFPFSTMERWIKRTALVTGASTGIGAAICRNLVKSGMNVVGCARNVQHIEEISDELKGEAGSLLAVKCDLNNESDILSMFGTIKSHYGGVDVCINNAGLAHAEPLLTGDTNKWREMFNVNVLAPSICTREAVKSMQEHEINDGHVIYINSLSGHRVIDLPEVHFFSATKFAITSLVTGLRNELRRLKSDIKVTAISPGIVESEFQYRLYPDKHDLVTYMFKKIKVLEPQDIADAVVFTLQTPKHCEVNDILLKSTEQRPKISCDLTA